MVRGRELLRDVVDIIEGAGGTVEKTEKRNGGHFAVRWTNAASQKFITYVAFTPSDYRGCKNKLAQVKRQARAA